MNRPSTTVIVPVYNVEKYITACVQSLFLQTLQPLKVIFVDDASTDQSISVLDDLLRHSPGGLDCEIVPHDDNQGLSAARNTGLTRTQTRFVFFLDSDDALHPQALETLYDSAIRHDAQLAIGAMSRFREDDEVSDLSNSDVRSSHSTVLEGRSEILEAYLRGGWPVASCNKLVRTDFLRANRLFFEPGLIHEDELWSFQLATHLCKIAMIDTPTYLYRVRNSSLTTSMSSARVQSYQRLLQLLHKETEQIDGPELRAEAFAWLALLRHTLTANAARALDRGLFFEWLSPVVDLRIPPESILRSRIPIPKRLALTAAELAPSMAAHAYRLFYRSNAE